MAKIIREVNVRSMPKEDANAQGVALYRIIQKSLKTVEDLAHLIVPLDNRRFLERMVTILSDDSIIF